MPCCYLIYQARSRRWVCVEKKGPASLSVDSIGFSVAAPGSCYRNIFAHFPSFSIGLTDCKCFRVPSANVLDIQVETLLYIDCSCFARHIFFDYPYWAYLVRIVKKLPVSLFEMLPLLRLFSRCSIASYFNPSFYVWRRGNWMLGAERGEKFTRYPAKRPPFSSLRRCLPSHWKIPVVVVTFVRGK